MSSKSCGVLRRNEKRRRVPKEAAALDQLQRDWRSGLVGFFWSNDHGGVAWLAWLAWGAWCTILAWGTWGAGRAWHWYWHGHWGRSSNWHFNGWGYNGWCWVNGGLFASRQGGDSQQCGTQSGDFHGGFLL